MCATRTTDKLAQLWHYCSN